jgi:hypothetical protein
LMPLRGGGYPEPRVPYGILATAREPNEPHP